MHSETIIKTSNHPAVFFSVFMRPTVELFLYSTSISPFVCSLSSHGNIIVVVLPKLFGTFFSLKALLIQ